jgi:hypothetical protein
MKLMFSTFLFASFSISFSTFSFGSNVWEHDEVKDSKAVAQLRSELNLPDTQDEFEVRLIGKTGFFKKPCLVRAYQRSGFLSLSVTTGKDDSDTVALTVKTDSEDLVVTNKPPLTTATLVTNKNDGGSPEGDMLMAMIGLGGPQYLHFVMEIKLNKMNQKDIRISRWLTGELATTANYIGGFKDSESCNSLRPLEVSDIDTLPVDQESKDYIREHLQH